MTIHLTLKKKWFDMIQSGEKKEEYREIKPHWISRLCVSYPGNIGGDFMDDHKVTAYLFKKFTHVKFVNGYSKHSPSMFLPITLIEIRAGRPEWGAEEGKKYFVISI